MSIYGAMMCRKLRRKPKGKENSLKVGQCLLMLASLDYLFRLAVEMRTLGLPWTTS